MIPHPAATCVVVRETGRGVEPEVLLVRRTMRASFLAGAHVFPGGRLDAADWAADADWCDGIETAASHWPDLGADESLAYHVAAIRELFEEAGLLVARDGTRSIVSGADARLWRTLTDGRDALRGARTDFRTLMASAGLRLALDALRPLARWVTPAFEAKRFDARFFLTAAPPGQHASHDAAETTQGVWMSARDALHRGSLGELLLFPPTWGTLRDLARFPSRDAMLASTDGRRILRREPRLVESGEERLLVLPGDPLYPAPEDERVTAIHPETRFAWDGRGWVPMRPPAPSGGRPRGGHGA